MPLAAPVTSTDFPLNLTVHLFLSNFCLLYGMRQVNRLPVSYNTIEGKHNGKIR